jgi:replicative DNA helicase
LQFGISAEDFPTLQEKAIFTHVLNYYTQSRTRGSVLSTDAFRNLFEAFELVEAPSMTTAALCHDVRQERLSLQLKQAALDAASQAETDPLKAAMELRQVTDSILRLGHDNAGDVCLSTGISDILEDYILTSLGVLKPIALWPWEPLNEATGGIQESDFIIFYGRPKSKKTFVLTYIIAQTYLQGKRALVYTKEMTAKLMNRRITAFIGGFPYQEYRLAKLDEQHQDLLFSFPQLVQARAEESEGRNDLIILAGQDAANGDGVTWLRGKIDYYKPDIVFVDGLYLMHDEKGSTRTPDWQRVMHISRDIRTLTLDTKIPIIATMQANRAAAKHQEGNLDEIAYSDATSQDLTDCYRVVNEKDSPTLALVPAGSREYTTSGIRINAQCCSDFSFHSLMDSREVAQATAADNETAEKHSRPRRAKLPTTKEQEVQQKMLNQQLSD